jgi:arylsulfate sulfotransferase
MPLRATCAEEDYSIIRDYGPVNTLDWTIGEHEGDYDVEVSARDNDTGATVASVAKFQFTPRVTGGAPAITPTANPLVFLYSAPSCPAGSSMRVQFQGPDGFLQSTNSKPCDGRTMNFYIAGMRPQTLYSMQHMVENGTHVVPGPPLTQATPDTSFTMGARTVRVPPPTPMVNPIILQARFGFPAATDAMGNLLWYSIQSISMISRPEPGGLFLGWLEGSNVDTAHQILREFDLAGTVLRETNAARVSEQLTAMGMHPINAFHHEVRSLPNGGILALAATERILTDVQGPGPVDVLGDIVLVLDSNLQVQWAWDTFDHLDPHRLATLNETCVAITGGCPPIKLAALANDWTHGNSAQLTPDGNILYSARHQDWVIKIDYRNGQGTGDILWRLGKDGDFLFLSSDPYPWFSHQHDPNIDANGIVKVFDNGNVRQALDPSANSRGQVIQLDETHSTATLLVNANLGDFSLALGSAQALPDGNYHFHLGFIPRNNSTRIVEVDPSGNIEYDMQIGELQYRSFRMQDLYSP